MNTGEKKYFKISAWAFLVLMMLAAAWHWGRPVYRQHKETRNVAAAQKFLDAGDYRNAMLSARLALLLNSNNVPACRIMAGVAEAARSPSALDWRVRIAALEPTPENKLALAAAGLHFQNPPFPLTTQLLDQLAPTATNLVAFQSVATELALRLNRLDEAETHLQMASQLEPTNKSWQLNLAVLRLNATNPIVRQNARTTLDSFRRDPVLGAGALRSLVAERLMHDDFPAARDYTTQLLAGSQAMLGDRLQYLTILKRLQSPDLAAQLSSAQRDAATNAMMVAQTAAWMEANGFVPETFNWLTNLPVQIQMQTPVQLTMVDYYIATTNWQGLFQFTAKGDWGEMNFLRLAFLSHAWSGLGETGIADANWNSALNQSGDQLGALNALLQLAGRWEMKPAQENLLEWIIQRYPDAGWAQQNLERLYLTTGETRKLHQFYASRFARSPQNTLLKNNLAATALLLKTNVTQAFLWAAEVYAQTPGSGEAVSTYAYALHLQGRDAEGLVALQKLKPAQLEQPSVALYYGVLLAATGGHGQAARFLAIAEKDGHLLPEEKQLLDEANNSKAVK